VLNGVLWFLRTGAPWHDLPTAIHLPNLPSPLFDQRSGKTRHPAHRAHKYNRRRKSTQDGRELRRYCRRWKIERLLPGSTISADSSAAGNSRGQISRMLQLGCLIILLRHL